MGLGKNVRIRRKQLGLTQAQVAVGAGLTESEQSWISAVERGKNVDIRLSSLRGLAKALDCTIDELQGSGPMQPLYIKVSENTIARTKEVVEDIFFVGYDSRGKAVGIEILTPARMTRATRLMDEPQKKTTKKQSKPKRRSGR